MIPKKQLIKLVFVCRTVDFMQYAIKPDTNKHMSRKLLIWKWKCLNAYDGTSSCVLTQHGSWA